jgi:AI-2 transport protein TqsA
MNGGVHPERCASATSIGGIQGNMHQRVQTFASGAVLVLIVGWVLHIGRDVFVPIVSSIFMVYVIAGLARLFARVPVLGRILPPRVRYALAVIVIVLVMVEVVYLVIASKSTIAAFAPRLQEFLLLAIQKVAAFFRIESEPTWTTLRQELVAQIDVQKLIGSIFASVSSIIVGVELAVLYTIFLLWEHRMVV